MAKPEGETPDNFDEMKKPEEETGAVEPSEEMLASLFQDQSLFPAEESAIAEPAPEAGETATETSEDEAVAAEMAEVKPAAEKEAEEKVEAKPTNWPLYAEWGLLAGIPVIFLAAAALGLLYFSTVIYLILVALIPYGIWKSRQTCNVYTVILGCALAAVLTALYCLWLEIGRYQFDVKARDAKQRVSACGDSLRDGHLEKSRQARSTG